MTSFRITNDYKCVESTSRHSSTVNQNIIIVIDHGFRQICNLSDKNSWISIINCLIHTSVPKIILSKSELEEDRKVMRQIPMNLIEFINSVSAEMKKVILPESKNVLGKYIHLKVVIKETLDDSMCNYVVPYSRFAKIVKYEKSMEQLFSEIFEATHPSVSKTYTSVIFQRDQIPSYVSLSQL